MTTEPQARSFPAFTTNTPASDRHPHHPALNGAPRPMPTVPSRPVAGRRRAPFLRLFGRHADITPALRSSTLSGAAATRAMASTGAAAQQASTSLTQAAHAIGEAAPHVRLVEPRPAIETATEVYNLTAVKDPVAVFDPGTYTISFGRMPGTVWPPDLVLTAATSRGLADAITAHLRPRITDTRPLTTTVDPKAHGGTIRLGDRTLGTFTYEPSGKTA